MRLGFLFWGMESALPRRMQLVLVLMVFLSGMCCSGAFAQKDRKGTSKGTATVDSLIPPVAPKLQLGTIEVITDPLILDRIRKKHQPTPEELNALDDDALQMGLLRGSPEALVEFKRRLNSGDIEVQDRALRLLMDHRPGDFPLLPDDQVRTFAKALLNHPHSQIAAISVLPITDPEHYVETLREFLRSDELEEINRSYVLSMLCDAPASLSTLQLIKESMKADPHMGYPLPLEHAGNLLDQYATADTSLRAQIVDILLAKENMVNQVYEHEEWMLDRFSEAPIPKLLPFFKKVAQTPSVAASKALLGIAKLEGKAARPLLMPYISKKEWPLMVLGSIRYAWKDDPQAALPVLKTACRNLSDEYQRVALLEDAWEIGGAELTEQVVQSLTDEKERTFLADAYHRLYDPIGDNHPLKLGAQRLAEWGLLARPFPEEAIEEVRREYRKAGNPDFEYSNTLADYVDCVAQYELDAGMSPTPYPYIILNAFVPAARGKLDGLECYRALNESDEEHMTQDVWIIFRGKGYHFVTDVFGYWCDVEAIQSAMEMVMEDAGFEERWVRCDVGSDRAGYIFCKPEIGEEVRVVLGL